MRRLLFWLHLCAGITAGVLILIMSVTGVMLTYERQLIEWSDRQFRVEPQTDGALGPSVLLERVARQRSDLTATAITMRSDPAAPALVASGQTSVYVNPYSGEVLGSPTTGMRSTMSSLRGWHRWLAMNGDKRALGKSLMGWANVVFLFIVLSGMYLWIPAAWTRAQVRAVAWFRGGVSGRARDFNWHNVIGIWSAIPLAVIVATAMPISFPWANAAVYRLMGEDPPQAGGGAGQQGAAGRPRAGTTETPVAMTALDARWAAVQEQSSGWRSINLRIPASGEAPFVFTVDRGNGGQPQLRSTVTLDGVTGTVVRAEAFADQSPGRQLRSWTRFTHTGEYYGIAGQTIAGVVTAGAVVLVYTGLALALRRLVAWSRRSRQSPAARRAA